MKNKKTLKLIALYAGIITTLALGVGGVVYSLNVPEQNIMLPSTVYNINQNGILQGFTDDFVRNSNLYKDYNTIQIPANVKGIADQAFYNENTEETKIPSFIKYLTFPENSELGVIGESAFQACSSLTSLNAQIYLQLVEKLFLNVQIWVQ